MNVLEWRRCELYDVINQADSNQNGGKKRVTTIADATEQTAPSCEAGMAVTIENVTTAMEQTR